MTAEQDREYFCLVFARTRRRQGKPVRVIHLHFPRRDIVNCTKVRDTVAGHEAGR